MFKSFLTRLTQFLVGGLFIFSGLVKMNDPVGFSFKLEEYFSSEVLNLPFLEPLALPLAIILVIVEVLLGAALLLGFWKRWVLILLSAMIGFFTFLTFWSAYFNQVTDCGCFGDAIPLKPWESFYKDVILSILILVLWWGESRIFSGWPKLLVQINLVAIPVLCAWFSYHVINHLPVEDFRPYAEGLSIAEGMKPAEELGLEPPQYEVVYTMENAAGQRQEITSKTYIDQKWWEKTDWTMLADLSRTTKVSEGYEPPVHDFSIMSDYGDWTDSILNLDEVWLLVAYNRAKTNEKGWANVLPTVNDLSLAGTPYLVMSASMPEELHALGLPTDAPFAFTDETTLKTMVRSNPGWVVLRKGVVAHKYHYNDSPH
ncbi:MAG TPA: DoxX family protein [Cryomorphaceae bacterium]|nr:DoxX family protein [Cryomorphaceae bacterium]HCY25642.1 DoxX family protein [Cryomorphaceae bacterium]